MISTSKKLLRRQSPGQSALKAGCPGFLLEKSREDWLWGQFARQNKAAPGREPPQAVILAFGGRAARNDP